MPIPAISAWRDPSRREQYLRQAGEQLPIWVSAVMVVLIAWQTAGLIWRLVPAPEAPDQLAAPDSAPAASRPELTAIARRVAAAHLFGQVAGGPTEAAARTTQAPDTRLDLALRGVFATGEPDSGWALIAVGRDGERGFRVGEVVTSGARLEAVHTDRVLLERDGRLEALRFPEADSAASGVRVSRQGPEAASGAASSDTLSGLRQQLQEDPSSLTRVIQPRPVVEQGRMVGYRVFPGQDRQRFLALGLRPGDLITEVNGIGLDDPQAAMRALQELGSGGPATVKVRRGDQEQVLVLRPDS